MRTLQVGIESVDRALLEAAVWWVRYGKPAADDLRAVAARKIDQAKRKRRARASAPAPISEGRGVEARGFAPARIVRLLAKKVSHAGR